NTFMKPVVLNYLLRYFPYCNFFSTCINKQPRSKLMGYYNHHVTPQRPVSTNERLDSGLRRNDDVRSKLRGIKPA
ncbi:MAG: hypothetical protein Q8Q33_08420, partial [Chlamydiota bacterium]|nr:hypothetical protein [Chlamydiota bacterium]